jgi:peptide/nickel transport system substrate-binding protein
MSARNAGPGESLPGFNRQQLLRAGAAGALGLGALGAVVGCGGSDASSSTAASGRPPAAPSGVLRVGLPTSGRDIVGDPRVATPGFAGVARLYMLFDTLATGMGGPQRPMLARTIEPSADARTWDVQLREGITFHNGTPLTVDQIVGSVRYFQAKDSGQGTTYQAIGDVRKTGPMSVRFSLPAPDTTFIERYLYNLFIVPDDFDPKRPVGTGPFRFESIEPARKTVLMANPDYWADGPFVERLEMYEFADDAARVNALLARQVDAIDQVPPSQIATLSGSPRIKILQSPGSAYTTLAMNTGVEPFSDVRVRQAFRLIADRQAVLDQTLAGVGRIANDLPSPFAAGYAGGELPQHEQDLERARALLREAGHENLTVTLTTAPIAAGANELAQVFAEQAKGAGVTVKLQQVDPAAYYTPEAGYGSYALSVSFGGTQPFSYLGATSQLYGPHALYPETHWDDSEYLALQQQALATGDRARHDKLITEMQRIDHDRGGYLIPAFRDNVTAYADTVHGFNKEPGTLGLSDYRFNTLWTS